MNLTTSSGLALTVKNLSYGISDLIAGTAYCSGFDLLTVNGKVALSFEEFNEVVCAAQYVEINNALDEAAQKLADDELATDLQARHDYRAACHG